MHTRRAAAKAYLAHPRHHCKAKRKVVRRKLHHVIGVKNKQYQTKVMRIRVRFFKNAASSVRTLYDVIAEGEPLYATP